MTRRRIKLRYLLLIVLMGLGSAEADKLRKKPYTDPPEWELVDDYGYAKGTWRQKLYSNPVEWEFVDQSGNVVSTMSKTPYSDEYEIEIESKSAPEHTTKSESTFKPIGSNIKQSDIDQLMAIAVEYNRQEAAYLNSLSDQERKEYLRKKEEGDRAAIVILVGIFVVAGIALLGLIAVSE